MAADEGNTRAATRLGAWWGAGHALMLLLIGFPLIFAKSELPAWLESGAEKAVGVVILVLALRVMAKWLLRGLPRFRARPSRRAAHGRGAHALASVTCVAAMGTTVTCRCEPLTRRSASGCCTAWPAPAPWCCC